MGTVGTLTAIGLKVGLAVVLALGATGALRYLHQVRGGPRLTRGRSLRVVESIPLAQGRVVHLISVGQRTFLLGSTASGIVLLAEVTGEQQATTPEGSRNGISFSSALARFLSPREEAPRYDRAARLRAAAEALRAKLPAGERA